jgi:hypothetical protein
MRDRMQQLWLCYRYCKEVLGFSRWNAVRLSIALHGSETFRAQLCAMREKMSDEK